MAVLATFTSGGKGGTGKTTLSTMLTLALALYGKEVLLVDCSSEGGAARLLLGEPSPPYFRDALEGKCSLYDTIEWCEVELGSKAVSFYLVPNVGPLPRVDLSAFFEPHLKIFEEHLDAVIFDLPAYQDPWYVGFAELSDVVVKVAEPNHTSFAGAASAYPQSNPSEKLVVFALNQPRPYSPRWIKAFEEMARQHAHAVLVFPYRPELQYLNPERVGPVFLLSLIHI